MADFADLRLDRSDPSSEAPEEHRPPSRTPAAILFVLALAALGVYLVWPRQPAKPAATRDAAASAQLTHPVQIEGAANINVPPLDESDALVRQLVSQLSQHPKVVAWLTTDHVIRNFAVVVLNIADHQSPAKHLKSVTPHGAFVAAREGGRLYIDPASYSRYDAYADALAAMDARGAARLYATLKPRIAEALRDLGDPRPDPDATLKRAMAEVLAAPAIDTRVPLRQPRVLYTFEDPALESLSPVQRQMLRMGPRNIRIVQQKLREIAPYMGIDPAAK